MPLESRQVKESRKKVGVFFNAHPIHVLPEQDGETATLAPVSRMVDLNDLVTAKDIAAHLGFAGPQVVHNWVKREVGFPEPVFVVGLIRLWLWSEVEPWLKETGKIT